MKIRKSIEADFEAIWPIFYEIVSKGETYGYPRDTSKSEALKIWLYAPKETYVIEEDNQVLGTYYIKTNQLGPGRHVCNCGYMVSSKAQGRGMATSMCKHSQKIAVNLGYKAMQFNFVASTNEVAINLWKKLGFDVVGCLPKAFNHPKNGFINAFVMYKWLEK